MGCDIHLAVQVKRDDKWDRVERVIPGFVFDDDDEEKEAMVREELYRGRNYHVFGALAGVRYAPKEFAPVAEGRGLPDDFAAELVNDTHEGTHMGDHSFTWMLLSEIEAYDWERSIEIEGLVNGIQRMAWMNSILRKPSEYCGDAYGSMIRKITLEQMDAELKSGKVDRHAYAPFSVKTKLRWECDDFLNLLPALRALAPDSSDIRLVMGFDS